MLTFACVLRSGGDYRAEHVTTLHNHIKRHLTVPHNFVCLTDMQVACETLPLRHGWPGWWSKIELFDGRLRGDVLYADLDTIPVGNLDEIATGHDFTVLENFWAHDRIGSGLMAWSIDLRGIYNKFCTAPNKYIHEYRTTERWGDQGFVRFNSPVPFDRWQRRHPGKVVSFKQHCRKEGRIPPAAAIVCFHGKPRPWEMTPGEKRWFSARGVQPILRLAGAGAQGAGVNTV